jgi:hypothetical protein
MVFLIAPENEMNLFCELPFPYSNSKELLP